MMAYFFTKSGKFICQRLIMDDKSKILLDDTKSLTNTVDIGIKDGWVHREILWKREKKYSKNWIIGKM